MVHPMFELDAEIKKYPLFGKALEATFPEIEGALFWTLGEMPLIALPGKILTTIDTTIDGTTAEKQALMVAALYNFAPAAFAAAQDGSGYDAETKAVFAEMATFDKFAVAPEKMARVSAALNTCLLSSMMPMMSGGPMVPAEMVAEAKKGLESAEKLFLPNLNAPKLEALFQQTQQDYISTMEGNTPQKKLAPKKRPGPKA